MKSSCLLLAMLIGADAFVARVNLAGYSRARIVASASKDYLTSTQKAVDVSQAADEIKEIKELVPKEYQHDQHVFERDPNAFKRSKGAKGKSSKSFPTPAGNNCKPSPIMAVPFFLAILIFMYLK